MPLQDKEVIEDFDKIIINSKDDKRNYRQANDRLAQHMTIKRKKKTKPITYSL